jgi:hypothetical protein
MEYIAASRLLKNVHPRRCPHPSSLRCTGLYDSLLGISGALYLDVFEQPENLGLDWEPFAGRTIAEAETPSLKKK